MIKTGRTLPKTKALVSQDARLAKVDARGAAAHAALLVVAPQMAGLLELAILGGGLPPCVRVPRASLAADWGTDVVAAVASTGARVVGCVSRVVVGVQVVVGGARRRVRVAAMAGTGRAVRVVAEEEVVVGIAGVLRA